MCFGKRLSLEVSCFFLIERSSREVGGGSAYKKNLSDVLRLGAENGARTRDLNLGKVALYQLSYFRVSPYVAFGIAKVRSFFEIPNFFTTFLHYSA